MRTLFIEDLQRLWKLARHVGFAMWHIVFKPLIIVVLLFAAHAGLGTTGLLVASVVVISVLWTLSLLRRARRERKVGRILR